MAQNHILLETIALTQSAASVTFDNIPQTGYTDLKIVVSARGSSVDAPVAVRFNSVTTGYNWRRLYGSGSAASSELNSDNYFMFHAKSTQTANTFGSGELYIPNYAGSQPKSCSSDSLNENNGTAAEIFMLAGFNTMTAAISSITFTPYSGFFIADSTFSLYGIASLGTTPVTAPFATGGNIVAQDGTYWYHAFLSSGTFTPSKALSCDMLVVAGGGAGGAGHAGGAGGGGAGGLLGFTSQSLTAINHTVTVGAGGAAQTSVNGGGVFVGNNGSNSVFGALTASVGGGGGAATATDGANIQGNTGGSGGGNAHWNSTATTVGGVRTTGQGFASGGIVGPGFDRSSTGGGGAGAASAGNAGSLSTAGGIGATFNTSVGGTAGPYSFINTMALATTTGVLSSGNYYYAGGGGGGVSSSASAGGIGGGGAGYGTSTTGTATSGTRNTGGGGGGASADASGIHSFTSGSGGSGIVIVRYPMSS